MRKLPVLAVVWVALAGCGSGKKPAPRDGAADSARPDAGGGDGPADVAGEGPPAEAGPSDAPAAPDAADATGDRGDAPSSADARPEGPPVSGACAAPTALGPTTLSAHGKLDLGGTPAAACGGAVTKAIFYSVDVPAGHRLTAVATSTAGTPFWQPALTLLAACDAASCLARSSAAAGGGFRLDWINNAAAPAHVVLQAAGNIPVTGGELDVTISLVDLTANCGHPIAVQDGTTLSNLDLVGIAPAANTTCSNDHGPALYYAATLLPQQELTVTAERNGNPAPVSVTLRTACNDQCPTGFTSGPARRINLTTKPETILIEVASRMSGLFNLHVSMPPAPAHITVVGTSPLVTTEAGGKATFQVVLESQPAKGVTVNLTSDHPTEGTVSPAKLVFDAANWSVPQTATVTGVDDQVGDGARPYSIVTAPAVSDDPLYAGVDAEDLPLTNLDDDPSVIVDGAGDVVTSEDGMPATFTVRLSSAPTGNVDVPLASSDTGEGTVSPASLRFTTANWNVPQPVTVTGADDAMVDGPQKYEIALGPLVSDDTHFGGQTPAAVIAHNRDDDFTAGTTMVKLPDENCGLASTPNAFPAAIDALGRIYVVMYCDAQLFLFKSDDGGKTVSAPTPIPGAKHADGGFSLAAARDGDVFLAFGERDHGLEVARSRDAGKSWTVRALMPGVPDLLRIGTARDTVVIAGDNPLANGGFDGTVVLRSQDAGWSYEAPVIIPGQGQMFALGLRRDGKSAWMVDDLTQMFGSDDAAKTWRSVGMINGQGDGQHCCYEFGSANVFSIAEGFVHVAALADAKKVGSFTGPTGAALAATIDDQDILTIVSEEPGTGMTATRFGANKKLASAKLGFPPPYFADAFVLSRRATAFVSLKDDNLGFTIVLW